MNSAAPKMKTRQAKAIRHQIKSLEARVSALRAELTDSYTVSLGRATVKCVQESLDAWTAELERVKVSETTTSQLFEQAQSALCAGRFSAARALLDDLARRTDNRDMLASAKSYRVPAHILAVIQDRIELVNSKAAG